MSVARVLTAAVGVGLVAFGASQLRRRHSPTSAASVSERVARALCWAAHVSWLRRASRDQATSRGVHLAPGCWPARLARSAAASNPPRSVIEAMAGVRAATGAGAAASCCLGATILGPVLLLAVPPAAIAASWVPDCVLSAAARCAQRELEAALPWALALLAAALRAGRSIAASLDHVAGAHDGPFAALRHRIRAAEAAGASICSALGAEAAVAGSPLLGTAAGMIDRHHRLGLALADPLSELAAAAHAEQHTVLRGRAARAVPLAGLLTATVIAPTCVIALATCLVAIAASRGGLPG